MAHRPFLTDELYDIFHSLVLIWMLDWLGQLPLLGVSLNATGYHNSQPELEKTILLSLIYDKFFARFSKWLQADKHLARDHISIRSVSSLLDLRSDIDGRLDLLGKYLDLPLLDLLESDFLNSILDPLN